MKSKIKNGIMIFLKYILIFIILLGVYFAIMTLSSLIPSEALKDNVRESSEILVQEGESQVFDLKYKTESIFTFTDALMINTAYSIDSTHPIESFILDRKNFVPGQTTQFYADSQYNLGANEKYINKANGDLYQTKELYGLMHGDNIQDSYEYARYWHGYLPILRPLLLLFNYSGIRIVLAIITLISVIALLALLCKKINITTGVIYGISLLAISIFIVTKSINEILIFIVAFISSIILLLKKKPEKNIGIFFFAVGSISNFIDLLTAPLVTLGITAITYFLLIQKNESETNIKRYILDFLKICISWALGYGITWVSKWVITEIFFGRPIISQAIEQAVFRSNGPQINGMNIFSLSNVFIRNMEYLSSPVAITILIIAVIYIIVMMIINRNKKIDFKENLKKCLPYILIFFLPVIWYMVLKQHSYTHVNFTYRILVISIISFLIIASKILVSKNMEDSSKQ